jgi:HK97 family phage portal protein
VSAYAEQGGTIEWWSTTQFGDQERFLSVADTMHFAWPATDSEVGVSPLEKLGVTIRLEDATQRYQSSSFRNGVRPGGVITLPAGSNPSPEVMAETRRSVEDMHKGVDKAFKIGLLAPGADWKPITQSAVELELIEQRKLNREEVGMVYDLAGPLMNDLEHGTYSNIEELGKGLYRDVLPPWLVLIQQTFQAQLIDPEPSWIGRFTAFDLSPTS